MTRPLFLILVLCASATAETIYYDQAELTAKYEDRVPELSVSIMVWRPSDDYAVATSASVRDTGLLSGIVALDGNKVTQGPLVATHHLSGSDESTPFKAWTVPWMLWLTAWPRPSRRCTAPRKRARL